MNYIYSNGDRISGREFRNQHQNISFSNPISAETLAEYGLTIFVPEPVEQPQFRAITRLELRTALLAIGVTSTSVMAVINAIPDAIEKETALMFWEDAQMYHREHALLTQIATSLGLSIEQVDEAWPE